MSDLPEEAKRAASEAIEKRLRCYEMPPTPLSGMLGWSASTDELAAVAIAAALPLIREQIWAEARTVLERQTDLTELIHFDRPSDFRKGISTCLAALDAARVARGSTPEQENPK